MDGWALGKSKVFLKYYHIEYLSKLYEEHVRKIVLVQACVRRWLAKAFCKREKQRRAVVSAVTLQKHVRGWLTRRRMNKLIREKQERERIERERAEKERIAREKKNNEQNKAKQAFAKAKLIHQMSNHELIKPAERTSHNQQNVDVNNKENEKAAIVIQSYYRGYTIRKMKLTPELEAKTKYILGIAKNRVEAQRMMQKEGFSKEDAARIIQRYYRTHKSKNEGSRRKGPAPQPHVKPLSAKDQQVDLIAFSQNVHMLNQEVHKNLRANKTGVPLDAIEKLPNDYKRPPGFVLVPGLLGTVPGGGGGNGGGGSTGGSGDYSKYSSFRSAECDHEMTKELIQSPPGTEFDEISPWDMPFYELERNLRSQRQRSLQQQQHQYQNQNQQRMVDINRNEILGERKVELSERKQQLSNNWHQAFQASEVAQHQQQNYQNQQYQQQQQQQQYQQDNKFKGMVSAEMAFRINRFNNLSNNNNNNY